MKIIIDESHNADKKQMIENGYMKLANLINAVIDKLDATAYQNIYPELTEMCCVSKLIGMLEILEESAEENEIDDEDYEGDDNND